MILRIKKRVFRWEIINESGAIVAVISNNRFNDASKKIMNSQGDTIFVTNIEESPERIVNSINREPRKYVVLKDKKPVATATLSPEKQSFAFALPRVNRMDVETPYGLWVIMRNKDNSLTISNNNELIATIPPFLFSPRFIRNNGKYDAVFLASIYMLIEYMIHEDDLIIV